MVETFTQRTAVDQEKSGKTGKNKSGKKTAIAADAATVKSTGTRRARAEHEHREPSPSASGHNVMNYRPGSFANQQ
jgi:hypothetical protein